MSGRDYDAVVIGSGLGGISAAAYLAAAGQRVLVLERYNVIGGTSHVFRRQGRWEFDCGVHYIGDCGPGGVVPSFLSGVGLDDQIEWLPLDSASFDTIVAPDLELRTPHGWDAYLENLCAAFPDDQRGLRRYIGVMRALGKAFDDRAVSMSSTSEMSRALLRSGFAGAWAMAPFVSLLVACGLKPRTILALSVQSGALASTPIGVTVGTMVSFLQGFVGHGAWYPRGGGQMLSAAFAEVVVSHGGQIRVNAEVDRILVEGSRVCGVRLTDGEEVRADTVVSDADIIRTYRDLVGYEHLPRATRLRVDNWRMTRPLINGFFGVEIDIQATPNSNFYAIPTWDDASSLLSLTRMAHDLFSRSRDASDRQEWAKNFATRQPMFVQCSTRRDPSNTRSAPAGHAAIEVQTIVPTSPRLWGYDGYDARTTEYRKDREYLAMKELIIEGMLARLDQVYPGASSRVKLTELGTPATQTRFTATTDGAAFGLEPNPGQFGPLRPGVRTPIDGLFTVGTSTRWGPGTEGSMMSGVHAASAITGRDLIAEIRSGVVLADRAKLRSWKPGVDPLAVQRELSSNNTEEVTA
ncbi:phytoene desaturase family protein [Nocardia cyriacigeorgica]|uniref:phytoene desaturase family protein n=1 Tax=Nocardia cyriacigeorgica TaxID=135487 RepID=UPI0024558906|nr:NAD(P)/FAD-dependent oxidoreductase [Nocardia cyriacigeorgica]